MCGGGVVKKELPEKIQKNINKHTKHGAKRAAV